VPTSLGYPGLGIMKKLRQALPLCLYPTGPFVSIATTLTMHLRSARNLTTYVRTAFHVSSLHTTSTLGITARLTPAAMFWTISFRLLRTETRTWMRGKYLIDTWKYQGREGVMS
jgi:hypothetical protein